MAKPKEMTDVFAVTVQRLSSCGIYFTSNYNLAGRELVWIILFWGGTTIM